MEPLTASVLLAATRGAALGTLPDHIVGVSTDSRSVRAGELFVALRGEKFDAHCFLEQAARNGAAAAVVDQPAAGEAPLPLLQVKDTSRALLDLAACQRRRLRAKVVAITGSNGKTTTKDLTAHALAARFQVVSSPRSFNNFVGVPLTLFLAEPETEAVVLEIGTNAPGEIKTLAEVARPDVAVITNVTAAHLAGLCSLEGVVREKGALLEHVSPDGVAILNADDESFAALRERARCRVVTTGVLRRADYTATMPACDLERIAFHLNGRERVRVPLLGCHNLYNALSALAVAAELEIPIEQAAQSLLTFEGPPMRLKKHRVGERLVIDDAYNANPGSMKAAIKTFAALDLKGRKVLVLGDMLELGAETERLHREVGASLSCGSFDLVAAVGAQAAHLVAGALEHGLTPAQLLQYEDAEQCARDLLPRLCPDDAVLVKGSRAMGLERVVAALVGAARGAGGGMTNNA
ncbi:MAG: UDP-N-acetylmuramoyl-tripeptide--D-alanyl-D-alanine ligase [Planctomycetes bacterium]|nr:UDP-N-acetylmuramoyl-tripeptide--D-alanyl-D-alanine ligase [Planctomycetota bacterium]